MTINEAMFSSDSAEWETPDNLFAALNSKYHFTLDPAASHENHKLRYYCTKEGRFFRTELEQFQLDDLDGLQAPWIGESVFLNPPYGPGIKPWLSKCVEEYLNTIGIVALLPARTDTKWFHDYVQPYAEVEFLRGRLRFKGAKSSAPFPSMLAVYRPSIAAIQDFYHSTLDESPSQR